MHERQLRKLAGRLQAVTRNTTIVEGYPCAEIALQLRELADYTARIYSSSEVSSGDIFSYVYVRLMNFTTEVLASSTQEVSDGTPLLDVTDREKIEKFENGLLEYLTSAPHDYLVRLLIQTGVNEEVACWRLTEFLHLEVCLEAPAVQSPGGGRSRNLYLVMPVNGFYSPKLECSLARRCIQLVKVFLFVAWSLHNKTYNLEFRKDYASQGSFDKHVVSNRYLEVLKPKGICPLPIRLPPELASFVDGFALRNCVGELTLDSLSPIAHESSIEAERVRAAIEWYIDAVMSEAETVKFIQFCIGLESLLGDELSDVPLSKTLADRCSYLVSNTIHNRAVIRKQFMEMYKVRSKVIHGTSRNMTDKEREHLEFARRMLSACIAKEIEYLASAHERA
ncbi:hypothetical protein ACP7H9_00075 [Idiomarina sp. ST20R2A10]|uniref:hypothetical protein n=1 Tax=Idiomarina sp. ST20R2A10 TaxID=3418369 RepID=UPI003EC907AE